MQPKDTLQKEWAFSCGGEALQKSCKTPRTLLGFRTTEKLQEGSRKRGFGSRGEQSLQQAFSFSPSTSSSVSSAHSL